MKLWIAITFLSQALCYADVSFPRVARIMASSAPRAQEYVRREFESGRFIYKYCQQDSCSFIGRPTGYALEEIRSLQRTEGLKLGATLVLDTVSYGNPAYLLAVPTLCAAWERLRASTLSEYGKLTSKCSVGILNPLDNVNRVHKLEKAVAPFSEIYVDGSVKSFRDTLEKELLELAPAPPSAMTPMAAESSVKMVPPKAPHAPTSGRKAAAADMCYWDALRLCPRR